VCLPSALPAQTAAGSQSSGSPSAQLPDYLAQAGIEQRLGQPLPKAAIFTDESGRSGPLAAWLGVRPVAMALVYYRCPMMCPQVLHGLAGSLGATRLAAGRDYDVLVFSIDPTDTPADAATQKQRFLAMMGADARTGAGAVHFLTGSQASIHAIAGATGFHYVAVPGPDGRMSQFAHSSVVMFATPDGRLSKYLSGIDYPSRDVRMALLSASESRISNPVDLLILYCCSYNPASGRYTVSVLRVLSIAAMVSVAALVGMLVMLTRRPGGTAAA
jgi:protein SCO1/2